MRTPPKSANKPAVSIVFPLVKPEQFAANAVDNVAVESVFAQSESNWELIFVCGSAEDAQQAGNYERRFPDRVRIVKRVESCGLGASCNAGARHASGSCLAFLNADEVWLPERLAVQSSLMQSQPLAAAIANLTQFWYSWSGNDSDLRRDFIPESPLPTDLLHPPARLLASLYPLGPAAAPSPRSLLIRREFFDDIGGFEEGLDADFEDTAFFAKLAAKGSVFVSSKCLSRRRIRPSGHTPAVSRSAGAARSGFLNWLAAYLDRENISEPDVLTALQRELRAQGPGQEMHRGKWTLRISHASEATLTRPGERPEATRVAISKCGDLAWDVQLNLRRQSLARGQKYRVGFEARAESPRTIGAGVSMAHEPWSGLGLYDRVEVTTDWQRYSLDFVAAADDADARIHFDLGGNSAGIDIASAGLFHEDGRPAPNEVQFGSLRRLAPVSRTWGLDRGLPIDRHYIERFLGNHAIDIRGRVLEIGDNVYTRRFDAGNVTRSDVLHVNAGDAKATFTGDLADAPHLPANTFDCVILTQTLQLIYQVEAAIQTVHRILRPGGVVLATLPGISPNNDREWKSTWYWNFTPVSARRLFAEVFAPDGVEVESFGNVLTATSFLQGLSAGELTAEELEYADGGYEVAICIRAVKRPPAHAAFAIPARPATSNRARALILMYHRIAEPATDPFSLSVSPAHFAEQLEVIRKEASTLTLAELAEHARQGSVPDRSVVVTFDDGYADNLHNAKPLLDSRSVPATVFITSGNPDSGEFWWDELARIFLQPGDLPETLTLEIQGRRYRWESGKAAQYSENEFLQSRHWKFEDDAPGRRQSLYLTIWKLLQRAPQSDRVRAMRELAEWSGLPHDPQARLLSPAEIVALSAGGLVEIGAHSVTHPALSTLPREEQRLEILGSKHRLEEILGSAVTSFAYPYGDFSVETVEIAAAAGFDRACSTMARAVTHGANGMELPRFHAGNWDGATFSRQLAAWFEHKTEFEENLIQ